ncbi:MAG: hypothetical protein RR977_02590 [Oscillospiraceae bacterium]
MHIAHKCPNNIFDKLLFDTYNGYKAVTMVYKMKPNGGRYNNGKDDSNEK